MQTQQNGQGDYILIPKMKMKYKEEEDKMRIKASIDLYYGGTNVWVNQRKDLWSINLYYGKEYKHNNTHENPIYYGEEWVYYGEEWVNQQLQQGINTSAKQKINNKRLMIQIQTTRMGQSRSKFKLIRYFTLVGVDSFYKDRNNFIFLKNTSWVIS